MLYVEVFDNNLIPVYGWTGENIPNNLNNQTIHTFTIVVCVKLFAKSFNPVGIWGPFSHTFLVK